MCVSLRVHMGTGARGGQKCQAPWSWSYSCALLDMAARNQTRTLWKNSMCSELLSHPSISWFDSLDLSFLPE